MKLLLFSLFACCLIFPAQAQEASLADHVETTLESLDLSPLTAAFDQQLSDETTLRTWLYKLASGQQVWDMQQFLQMIVKNCTQALYNSITQLSALMIPAALCSILERMRLSFVRARAGEMMEIACFLALAAVMASDLGKHMQLSEQSILRMANAMQALFPLLLTLLTAVGGTSGAAFYQPALTAAGSTMITLVRSFTLKLALGHGAVTMLSHISNRMQLSHLSALLRQIAVWTLGIAFTLFLSVTTLQGVSASIADGLSIRTAKYAVHHFVPVVGGMFADTMDALVGSSLLVQNALGVTGLIGLLLLCAGPLVQTLCASWVYKLSAALLDPIAPRRITRCIQSFSQVLTLFFIIQLSVGAMFFLLVAQLLAVGNVIVMLR